MSTDYYYIDRLTPGHDDCPTCHRPYEEVRFGHSAGGWAFAFIANEALNLTTAKDWLAFLKGKVIRDEYGRERSLDEIVEMLHSTKGQLTGFTASRQQYGGSDPHDYEYLDPEGYRMFKR